MSNDRLQSLCVRPLVARTMNAHLGALGRACDVSVPPGWLDAIEKVFDSIEVLPADEWPRIIQIKEKFAELRVYYSGGSETAHAAIGRAIGDAAHACQLCGSRGRVHQDEGWYATLCATHCQPGWSHRDPAPGIGTPFPRLPVLVGFPNRSVPPTGLRLNGTEYGLRNPDAEMAAYVQRFLDPADAIALAFNPLEVTRLLEEIGARSIGVTDARDHARAGAAALGLDAWAIEAAISEAETGGGAIDAGSGWRLLTRAIFGAPDLGTA